MYPVSAAVKALFDAEQKQKLRITSASPALTITDADVMVGGFSIDRYACNGDRIEVGTAIASEMTLNLDNRSGQYDGVTFEGTELYVEVGATSPTLLLSEYPSLPISISASNKVYKSGTNYAGRQIPIDSAWTTVTIKANSASQSICTFLKTALTSTLAKDTDITSYLATGETGRHTVAAGKTATLTVPADAAYMFITTDSYGGIVNTPNAIYAPATYYIPCGYFTSYEQPRALNTITLHALDRMCLFDTALNESSLTFPATVSNLVGQICTLCGVTLAASISSLPNASFSIAAMPTTDGKISYRTLLQWCAGLMGTNAWIDWDGKLAFSWFDNATGYNASTANRFSSDLYENAIVITGVKLVEPDADETVRLAGTDTYALDLTGNRLFKNGSSLLTNIYNVVHDYAYTPFLASVVSAPYLWPMDRVTFTDKDGNGHVSMLSNVNFKLNGRTTLQAVGQTGETYKLMPPSNFTNDQQQELARINRENSTEINNAVSMATSIINGANGSEIRFIHDANDKLIEIVIMDSEDISTAVKVWRWNSGGLGYSSNGYAGPYTTAITQNGAIVADFITTGKLNADRIYGGTVTLGGNGNANGQLKILDANGNVIGEWNSTVFNVNTSGPNGTLRLDGDGGHLSKAIIGDLDCPNAAKLYNGTSLITVGTSNSTYLSLQEAFNALNNAVVPYQVKITMEADLYETATLKGCVGQGGIIIDGAGYSLQGRLNIYTVHKGVDIYDLTIKGTESAAVDIVSSHYVFIHSSDAATCTMFISGGTSWGIYSSGSGVRLDTVELTGAPTLIQANYLTHLLTNNLQGSGTTYLATTGATVHMAGTRPSGAKSLTLATISNPTDPDTLTVNTGGSAPVVTPTTSSTLACTASGTYYGNWEAGNNMLQGRYDNATYAGAMWFDTTAISGKTIRSATLTIRRMGGFGTWDTTNIYLCGTTLTGKSGNPITGYTPYGSIGNLAEGATGTFAVPTTAIQALANGTIKGLMLYIASDTSNRGNIYSDNFSAYSGYGSGNAPSLEVTYDT